MGEQEKKTILLVEDEALIAMDEAQTLENHGFEVIIVYTAEEAIATVNESSIDLILMDLDFGKGRMDGTEAATHILEKHDLPIVFLTSHAEKEYVNKVKNITGSGYILKNSGEFVLIESINMAFTLFEAKQEAQKHMEESENRELRLEHVFDAIQDGISVLDTNLTITRVNSWMEEMHAGEMPLVGKKCYAAYQHRETVCPWCPSILALTTGENHSKEVQVPSGNGSFYWTELSAYPLKDEHNHIIGVIEYVKDITERKEAEEALRENQQLLREAHQLAHIGVWTWEIATDTVIWTDELYHIAGRDPNEPAPTYEEHPQIYTPDSWRRLSQAVEHTLQTGVKYQLELELVRPDGSTRTVIAIGGPRYTGDSEITGLYGIVHDITEYKNAILERRQVETKLTETQGEKNFLMQELNHRVKNNLAMISSLISLKESALQGKIDLSDIKHQIDVIRIVHEKLYQTEQVTSIDFKDYIQDLLYTLFSSFTEQSVTIENNIGEISIPTKTAIPLGLIINEIASNSIKHAFSGDGEKKFSVGLEEREDEHVYELTISNSGSPFPEEISLDNPSTLGLQLICALVAQIGGTIELQRQPHPVFTIRFPEPILH
jgi:PAS domain S-box-containing protein